MKNIRFVLAMLFLGSLTVSLITCGRPLGAISLTTANLTVPMGATQQLIATGAYSDGTNHDLATQVTWISSNTSVATVDSSGLVTAVGAGNANITASGTNFVTSGPVSGSFTLTVTSATLSSIAITPANPSIPVGVAQQFKAIATYSDGTSHHIPTTQVTWSSSNKSLVTINSSGLATAVAAGTATITATSGGISASTALTVTSAALSSLAVTPANPIIPVGVAQQFAAMGTYSDGTSHDIATQVTWGSSNTSVATVTSSGLAIAVAPGTATITATSGSISVSTTLTVTSAALSSIVVTPGILVGSIQQFTATGRFSEGGSQDITTQVTWSSSNTSVATVSSGGLATGVAPGTATITATQGGISASASITVISN